jgi:hypothetical protein
LALVTKGAVRLPIAVSIASGSLPQAGDIVRIGDGSIVTENDVWRPVRWWDPRPHLDTDELIRHGSSLLGIVAEQPSSSFGLRLADSVEVAMSLVSGDVRPALGVIGLGPGLTPAGDDVIAGALAVLCIADHLGANTAESINTHASTHTTALSAALLVAAGKGQVIPQAANLLSTLAAGGSLDRLRLAAKELFGVGGTSGHDLCAGMAGALTGLGLAGTWHRTGELETSTRSTR